MTEEQWAASTDPERMLAFLRGKVSDRKLRHFLVACARRVLPASPDEDMLAALEVAERFADGAATRHGLARARSALKTHHQARVARWSPLYTAHIRSVPAWHATREQVFRAAGEGSRCCAWSSTRRVFLGRYVGMEYPQEELAMQAHLLRDISGDPFRPASPPPASSSPTVRSLSCAAYEDRILPRGELDPARLAVLADGLEEAGCSDPELLGHLRGPGPHVPGCWALDALLRPEG